MAPQNQEAVRGDRILIRRTTMELAQLLPTRIKYKVVVVIQ